MILTQNYPVPAGSPGLQSQSGGNYFFLLGGSEPLNITLFDKSQNAIAQLYGVIQGVRLGPFKLGFTSWQIVTQSGAVGTAMVAISDQEMDYDIAGGQLGYGGVVNGQEPTPLQPALFGEINSGRHINYNGYGFWGSQSVAAVGGDYNYATLGNTHTAAACILKLERVRISSATVANFVIGTFSSSAGTAQGYAKFSPINRSTLLLGSGQSATLPVYAVGPLATLQAPPNNIVELDLTDTPLYMYAGNVMTDNTVIVVCQTVDLAWTCDFEWSELPLAWAG
ncbi:MAG: hypothetical protein WBR15_10850 [Gammaproteobacteria bacterium]